MAHRQFFHCRRAVSPRSHPVFFLKPYLKTQRVQQTTPPSRDCGAPAVQKQELRSLYLADTRCQVSVLRSNLATLWRKTRELDRRTLTWHIAFYIPIFGIPHLPTLSKRRSKNAFHQKGENMWKLYVCVYLDNLISCAMSGSKQAFHSLQHARPACPTRCKCKWHENKRHKSVSTGSHIYLKRWQGSRNSQTVTLTRGFQFHLFLTVSGPTERDSNE